MSADWTRAPATATHRRARPNPLKATSGNHPRLTKTQREVLVRIANGDTTAGIAQMMGVSEETVKSHVRAILRRLNARNRSHAVALGFLKGLLTIGSLETSSGRSSSSLYESESERSA